VGGAHATAQSAQIPPNRHRSPVPPGSMRGRRVSRVPLLPEVYLSERFTADRRHCCNGATIIWWAAAPFRLGARLMDPLTAIGALCVVGYWVFRTVCEESEDDATPQRPKPKVVTPAPTRASQIPETKPTPPKYASVADCICAEYMSYSRLRCYASCPHKFRLAYVEGRQGSSGYDRTGPGTGFHEYCAATLGDHIGRPIPSLSEVDEYPDFEEDEDKFDFIHEAIDPRSKIVAVEHELRFKLRGIDFFGIVDLVLHDHDGVTHLVDYKTGESPRAHLEQLELYCLPVLLASNFATARCSYILVDARETITWEVGPRNRQTVIDNVFRLVDHMMQDRLLPPRISSKCRECGFYGVCHHARPGASTSSIDWPTLTSAKRGAARRRNELGLRASKRSPKTRTRRTSTKSLFVTVARTPHECDETGRVIQPGEKYFARKNGLRLSIEGFQRRYPGMPLPTKTKHQLYGSRPG